MKQHELKLIKELCQLRRKIKNTRLEPSFIIFFEKLDSEPNVLHENLSIITRK